MSEVAAGYAVRRADPGDAAAIAEVYNESLGSGYLTAESAAREIAGDPRGAYFVAVAPDGAVAGAANARWLPRSRMLSEALVGQEAVVVELLRLSGGAQRLGALENVAVRPAHRGHALALELVWRRLRWLGAEQASFVYSYGWKTPQGCHIERTLLRAGFQPVREVPEFFLRDGLEKGYGCPFCGAECHCSIILFVRQEEATRGA